MTKLYSAACERNREPILDVLRNVLPDHGQVLEIGSGTGQHAVYFGARLPRLTWQASDLPRNHPSIHAWLEEARLPNVLPPLALDVAGTDWPEQPFDGVFTANTCHIMAWEEVRSMFANAASVLRPGGVFCVYGPFNYRRAFTSESNAQFDASLRSQTPHMGIRDAEQVMALAEQNGFRLVRDEAMPANNRLIVWERT